MTERLRVHPDHPAPRSLRIAAERIQSGALAVLPSDAGYLFAWALESRDAEDRAVRLRRLDTRHPFTVLCRGLSEVGSLAKLDDRAFRLVKSLVPGPYTFILPPGAGLPKRLKQAKRRTVGCRVPDHAVTQALLDALGAPLLSTSLVLPGEELDNHDAETVAGHMLRQVDLMLDAGDCPPGPTNVVDLTGDEPQVTRPGWRELQLD
jgi:tRNA threonylcarbamoyl adenosine modification protein (Sua5/YciO/YrdC/YwlC family)